MPFETNREKAIRILRNSSKHTRDEVLWACAQVCTFACMPIDVLSIAAQLI